MSGDEMTLDERLPMEHCALWGWEYALHQKGCYLVMTYNQSFRWRIDNLRLS